MILVTSFRFRHGVPSDADLVFDVRFLPNPNYVPSSNRRRADIPAWPITFAAFLKHRNSSNESRICCSICCPTTFAKEKLSYDRFRLYRRAAPVGHDGG